LAGIAAAGSLAVQLFESLHDVVEAHGSALRVGPQVLRASTAHASEAHEANMARFS
jgi:hypothetical protein